MLYKFWGSEYSDAGYVSDLALSNVMHLYSTNTASVSASMLCRTIGGMNRWNENPVPLQQLFPVSL